MAASVMRPEPALGHPRSPTPTSLLDDVQKQVMEYISEQRVRDPLEHSAARGGTSLRGPAVSPFRRAPRPRRRTSNQKSPLCGTQPKEIPLQMIFDTPECRTQVSPSEVSPCQLYRRGATFHRVDEAVAEESERRNQQWTQQECANARREIRRSLAAQSQNHSAPDLTLERTVTSSPEPASRSSSSSDASAASSVITSPLSPSSKCNSILGVCLGSTNSSKNRNHQRAYSLSDVLPESLYPSPHHNRTSSPDDNSAFNRMSSQTSAPSLVFSTDDDHHSGPPSPTLTADSDAVGPMLFEEPLPADSPLTEGQAAVPDMFEEADLFDGGEFSNNALAATLYEKEQKMEEEVQGKRSRLRWPSRPRISIPHLARIDSIKIKTPEIRGLRMSEVRKWAVSDSVTSLLHRRKLAREDTDRDGEPDSRSSSRQTQLTSSSTDSVEFDGSSPASSTDTLLSATNGNPQPPPLDQHPAFNPPASVTEPLPERHDSPPKRPSLHLNISDQHVASAVAEEEVALSHPPRIRGNCARQPPRLATILEVSTNQDDDKEAVVSSPARTITIAFSAAGSSPSCNLPIPVLNDDYPTSPNILHGPIRLSVNRKSTAADSLDWTAFQMAISGPTGDYLMGGGSGVDDADAEPDGNVEEEIIEWFQSYGYSSEGLLLTTDDEDGDADSEEECEFEDSLSPVELPAPHKHGEELSMRVVGQDDDDEQRARRNGGQWAGKRAWQMSCNLNDLGEFLSFEMYGGGGL
ncbi:MAG: hypothetical protein M1833_004388 [Piccolia ochrophora]|nr:MAG: hypothetical protein M1833_004388 [Piccolia ochrophora]